VRGRKLSLNIHEQSLHAARASHAIPTARPNTISSGPWWNARSPGSPVTTEKSATETHQNDHWLITVGRTHTGTNWAVA